MKWKIKNLLAGDGSGKRVDKEYEGIVEQVEYNELSNKHDVYVSIHDSLGQIVRAEKLELIEKDVCMLEGDQTVMQFQGGN